MNETVHGLVTKGLNLVSNAGVNLILQIAMNVVEGVFSIAEKSEQHHWDATCPLDLVTALMSSSPDKHVFIL